MVSAARAGGVLGSYASARPRQYAPSGFSRKVVQTVVPAQVLQVVGAPHVSEVRSCVAGIGVGDVDQPQGGGVLEEQAEHVPALDNAPVVRAAGSQAAVLRFREVQMPGVTGDVEVEGRRLHELREVVEAHPPAERAFRERIGDDRPAT